MVFFINKSDILMDEEALQLRPISEFADKIS